MAARSFAVMHTCIYNACCAYDAQAYAKVERLWMGGA